MLRLAILATHPIQYQAPWFRGLAAEASLSATVFYCRRAAPREQGAAGFGVEFDWDVPLLEGYPHEFLADASRGGSIHGFFGARARDLVPRIERNEFDAVLVNGWHYAGAWDAIRACWRSGVPVLVRSDSQHARARPLWKRAVKALPYRWFLRRLDGCVAVGTRSREYFAGYGVDPARIFLVPHVVDEARFREQMQELSPRRYELREAFGLGRDAAVFLFAGKLVPKKRPLDFLAALAQVHRHGGHVEGLVVGDGPMMSECRTMARRLDSPVRFAGFLNQAEIARAYAASDCLIMCSDESETWGVVVNEAMVCGLPALVSDAVGCAPDLIVPGETGDLFPLGDMMALADGMTRLAAKPDRLRSMGRAARDRIASSGIREASRRTVSAVESIMARVRAT